MKVNSPVKILLVDDLPENLFALELILSNMNYLCVKVHSGNEALKILLHEPDFALILMDVQMPEMDGFETVELIREIETLKHVPIIFLTASMDNSMHIFKGYQAGAVDYMIKPLNPELLKAKAAVFVDLYLKTRELLFQNKEKEKQAEELRLANKELIFQNEEKENRAAELVIANKELAFQNEEKEKRAADLIILSKALVNQKEELRNKNKELHEKALLLQQQEVKLITINNDLLLLNQHLEKRVLDRTSELENLNHHLKNLSLSKDKFLSVISHDLRNPLTALIIASDKLSNDIEEHVFDEIQPYARSIHRSSHNILKQLNELVDWANRQKEKTSFNPEKLKLVFAVDQSFELLKATARQKNIFLDNKVSEDIYVMADFLMLRSILQNLVTNAIKFSREGGLVKVFALRINNMVEVCVNDVGIGMEATVHKNLFTKAGSTTESGTNSEKGSGLGLILVKDFVSQHDGTIRVESEMEKGTCIFFTIPVGEL